MAVAYPNLKIPVEQYHDLLAAMGALNKEMMLWAEKTGNLSKYNAWSASYNSFLNMVEGGWEPDVVASRFRSFQDYTEKVMGMDWWTWVKATTRGAMITAADGIDAVAAAAKTVGAKAADVADTAARAVAQTTGRTLAAFYKPLVPYIALAGGGAVVAYLAYRWLTRPRVR